MQILRVFNELEYYHQELKKEYFEWAEGRLPNNGIGATFNKETLKFLGISKVKKEVIDKLEMIRTLLKNLSFQNKYDILREFYIIHPSFHELWFFNEHFNHFTGKGEMITGRYGFKSYLTSLKKETLSRRIKGISTFILKRTILLENLFSGVLNHSLFHFSPLDDKELLDSIENLVTFPPLVPDKIKSDMPIVFRICRTLLEKTDFDALKTNKLLSKKAWIYYAPCNINEGPIFIKKSGKNRIDILKELNSIDQNEIRIKLSKHFDITTY